MILRTTLARALAVVACLAVEVACFAEPPRQVSGIYPHLAMFNDEGECGTGAVVPWAGKLWVVTYAPHKPRGSSDKLYEIDDDLRQTIRAESIGGTPANRMIHRESRQLFIGPYAIDEAGHVRVIPYDKMFGRPTGLARHLLEPRDKVYLATMEEGLYEIDVHTLAVHELWRDEQLAGGRKANLPGYHGKGLYSGQGRLVYANNGEHGAAALRDPRTPSGVLAEWDGTAPQWQIVRRNQFTEVTGPGGLEGNADPGQDPVWSIGWDHRSLILMVLDGGQWHTFRLPKASHSYDGAHGWNTEWPRIRDIGEEDLLMTMHGAFWRFPRRFSASHTSGLRPRSNYLKVIGDFTRWHDRLVCGCDDTAKAEFLNKRQAKGAIAAPQSQSNLWFLEPRQLDDLGPTIGRGGLWLDEAVASQTVSDPFLVAGFERRWLHLAHRGDSPVEITVESRAEAEDWKVLSTIPLPPQGYVPVEIQGSGEWIRLRTPQPLTGATAWLTLSNPDPRGTTASSIFAGLATRDARRVVQGVVRARAENKRTLSFAATEVVNGQTTDVGYYELDGELQLKRVDDPQLFRYTQQNTAIPLNVLTRDQASLLFVDDQGRRWRLPDAERAGASPMDDESLLSQPIVHRVAREVATERDLLHAGGTFFELPAENAGGMAKLRPVASHAARIHDFCSYRGLLVLTGIDLMAAGENAQIIRSDDGRAGLWVGAVDDLWKLGRPRGVGGPWNATPIEAGAVSDPYLLMGYEHKSLKISHDQAISVRFQIEVDPTGDGRFIPYRAWDVSAGEEVEYPFPAGYGGAWMRAVASHSCRATVRLQYR